MVKESKSKSEVEEEAMMVSLVNVKVFALQNAGVNCMQESGEWAESFTAVGACSVSWKQPESGKLE